MNCFDSYCQQIIRPPKRTYHPQDLGPKIRFINNKQIVRVDFQFQSRKLNLMASYYISETNRHRCAIYLHGNASCRLEGLNYIDLLANSDINLCVLDFAGCGLSEGEYITMGYFESEDVQKLMDEIILKFGAVDEFILWGRSMGAVTALLLSRENRIKYYIVDSAFTDLRQLLQEIGSRIFGMFSFLIYMALPFLKRKINEIAHFDIDNVNPITHIGDKNELKHYFFVAGKNDTLISNQHTLQLYEACRSNKKLEICEGDHNTNRPITTQARIIEYLQAEYIESDLVNQDYKQKCKDYFEKSTKYQIQLKQEQDQELKSYVKQLERRSMIQQLKRDVKESRDYDMSEFDNYF